MKAKFIIFFGLLVTSPTGFSFFHIFDDPVEIAPHIVCTGVEDGTKLPDDTDCGHFYLCDGGASLRLACRSTEPHFDRCTEHCIDDPSVCAITDCSGNTEAPTEAPTETSTQTSTQSTTQTTTKAADTTTKFISPTVPNVCTDACENAEIAAPCTCQEQMVCKDDVCVCDSHVQCRMTEAVCAETCGCTERCDCPETDSCLCKEDKESIQCPFDDTAGECVQNCGCQKNCQCADDAAKSGCTCLDPCTCIEPPKVCPFKPADCVATCSCQERCICNGEFCRCDSENACPTSFWKRH